METDAAVPVPARSSYHHGALRQALIEAGLALMEERQSWDFSLRELARRAGVSHNAPYKHFADKGALLASLAGAGFKALTDAMEQAATQTASPQETLAAIGRAYVRFGVSRPAHYRLMFGATLKGAVQSLPDDVRESAAASQAVLRRVIEAGAAQSVFDATSEDPRSIDRMVLAAWALVHGVTMLCLDNLIDLDPGQAAEAVITLQMGGLLRRG
jgi:AcrR family transcriptional regulator